MFGAYVHSPPLPAHSIERQAALSTLGVCLVLAASIASGQTSPPVFVPGRFFTLAWTHSIEKVRWEEDYEVLATSPTAQNMLLAAVRARIKGSAAGMEPPKDSILKSGWYEYTPTTASSQVLRLTRSEFTADYELCLAAGCQPLSTWLPSDNGITLLAPCAR